VIVRRDPDRPRGLVTELADGLELRVDLVERRPERSQQALASVGATLRVVRFNSRTPRRISRRRTV
jgi:hypothetical protein